MPKVLSRDLEMTGGKITAFGATILDMTAATAVLSASITAAAGSISRTELSSAAGVKTVQAVTATQATTGAVSIDIFAPASGSVSGITFNGVDALAASDTNYITWTVTNRGQAGAGTTVVLDTNAVNTTKVTGGTAISANTNRTIALSGTAANLVVVAGDILRITSTATGTLANTVTLPKYFVTFSGTT
jgi:hypothetical protein